MSSHSLCTELNQNFILARHHLRSIFHTYLDELATVCLIRGIEQVFYDFKFWLHLSAVL